MYVVEITFEDAGPRYMLCSDIEEARGLFEKANSERYSEKSSLKSGDCVNSARLLSVSGVGDRKKAVEIAQNDLSDLYKEIRSTLREDKEISDSLEELLREQKLTE